MAGNGVSPFIARSDQNESHQIVSDEVNENDEALGHLEILLQKENTLYLRCDDYLAKIRSTANGRTVDIVDESWRCKLCEWCYEVADHFKFDREVVSIALNYLDRSSMYWLNQSDIRITKKEYQLLAVASLYLAIKIHGETDCPEGPRRKLKIDAFCELSRKQFDVQVIESTERYILSALKWNVNPPSALTFIASYLSLCPKWENSSCNVKHASVTGGIYDVARYLSELSVCQSDFTFSCKTSTIAFCAILFAIEALHATLPLPYNIRVVFLNNIAQATGLVSGSVEVLRVLEMLKKICPEMIAQDESSTELQDDNVISVSDDISANGKVSPVCVVDIQHQDHDIPRKRSRSTEDDTWCPIQHSQSACNI